MKTTFEQLIEYRVIAMRVDATGAAMCGALLLLVALAVCVRLYIHYTGPNKDSYWFDPCGYIVTLVLCSGLGLGLLFAGWWDYHYAPIKARADLSNYHLVEVVK